MFLQHPDRLVLCLDDPLLFFNLGFQDCDDFFVDGCRITAPVISHIRTLAFC